MSSPHIVALTALALLLGAVVCDLRDRTIPDWISVALLALGAAATGLDWHPVGWGSLAGGAGVAFGLGAALFYLGAIGGGDAKLCAGLGAICGWPRVFEALFATALCGGVLSFVAQRRGAESLPYAPAIAAGYAVTITVAWTAPPSAGLWSLITGATL